MCHGQRKKKKTASCLFGFCNEVETKVKYIDYVSPPKMMVIGGGVGVSGPRFSPPATKPRHLAHFDNNGGGGGGCSPALNKSSHTCSFLLCFPVADSGTHAQDLNVI